MRRGRATRPDWASLRRGAVADGKDKIELRSIGKLAPALGGIALCRITQRLERMNRPGVYLAGRIASGAVGLEAAFAVMAEDGFAQDRASGIARAQEQHVQRLIGHGLPQQQEVLTGASCGAQQALDAAFAEASWSRSGLPPYVVLSPSVRNASHTTPSGSAIQLFSDCA